MSIIKEVIENLSGENDYGKPKSFFTLMHLVEGTDSSLREIENLFIDKPIIKIYRSLQNVIIDFIYDSCEDMDLAQQWSFLNFFHSPKNSVVYELNEVDEVLGFTEETEEGNDTSNKNLYLHTLKLVIIDRETQGKYHFENLGELINYNLIPERPGNHANILRMTFQTIECDFKMISDDDLHIIQNAAMREAELDVRY